MAKNSTFVKVVLSNVRFSHPHVYAKHAFNEKDDPKYRVVAIIKKEDTVEVKKAMNAVNQCMKDNIQAVFNGKEPAVWNHPLHDGDDPKENRKGDPNLKGCYYINCKSEAKPKVVYPDKVTLIESPDIFYAGCYGIISLTLFAYSVAGEEGIGVWVNSIMKTMDGERLGNLSDPESDFADVELPDLDENDPNSLI